MHLLYAVVFASGLYTNGNISSTMPVSNDPFSPFMSKYECEQVAQQTGGTCKVMGVAR